MSTSTATLAAAGGGGDQDGGAGGSLNATSQVPSKRDKRRNLLADRLNELTTSFERDRDMHYRAQLTALQQDFNAISRADTSGRNMRMLDDGAEEMDMLVTGGLFLGDSAMSSIRGPAFPGGIQPGAFYAGFVAEVNEKMEERDVGLAMLHRQYHQKLAALKSQYERNVHHAREEHLHLAITMKQRLINRLYNAKKKLALDKEQLDVSDSNALYHHPNQFSIGGGGSTILGSPSREDRNGLGDIFGSGGRAATRKLRQRRNEVEDLIMGSGGLFDTFGRDRDANGNGDSAKSAAQRRKARAARHNRRMGMDEEELLFDDVFGGGAVSPSNNGNSNAGIGAAQLASLLHRQQANSQVAAVGQELVNRPVWSIEKLFTEKELQMAGNYAALATVRYFTGRKKSRKENNGGGIVDSDDEDNSDETHTPPATLEAGDIPNAPGNLLTDFSSLPLPPTATTLFSSTFAGPGTQNQLQGHHNTRSHANPFQQSQHLPLLNSAAAHQNLNNQPPPTLAHLSFMTPSATGYGAAAWQHLGVPATYFSAGTGTVVNTARAVTLSAPAPAGAKADEVQDDLEVIRRGVEVDVEVRGEEGVEAEEGLKRILQEVEEWEKRDRGEVILEGEIGDLLDGCVVSGNKNGEQKEQAVGLGLVGIDAGERVELETAAPMATSNAEATSTTTSTTTTTTTATNHSKPSGPIPVPVSAPPAPSSSSVSPSAPAHYGIKRRASSFLIPDAGDSQKKRARKSKEPGIDTEVEAEAETEMEKEKEKELGAGERGKKGHGGDETQVVDPQATEVEEGMDEDETEEAEEAEGEAAEGERFGLCVQYV
ncbi:Sds3-like-domain-containing protein [Kalaharituber pfeilii]|nr:Sds3-like-domain-containing protein [Kalaharituber pfeilii]